MLNLNIAKECSKREKILSDVHHVLNNEVPVHNAYNLSIKPKNKAIKHKDKLLIVGF